MTTRILLACGILAAGIVYAVVAADPPSVGLDAGDPKITRDSANRIEQALQERSDCNFKDNPLEECMEFLADAHGIPIWLDKQALQDEGITTDQQITLVMSGITLQTALSLTLDPIGLTHITEDGVLKITTQAKACERMSTRVYPVADLVDSGASLRDYDTLITLIENNSSGKWMAIDQEGGVVDPFPNARSVLIRQTQKVHREIEGLLAALRKAKRLQRIASIPINADEPDFLNPVEPAPAEPRARIRTQRATQTWQRPRVYSAE